MATKDKKKPKKRQMTSEKGNYSIDRIIELRGYDRKEVYSFIELIPEKSKDDPEYLLNVLSLYKHIVIDADENWTIENENTKEETREKGLEGVRKYAGNGEIWNNVLLEDDRIKIKKTIDTMRDNKIGSKGLSKCGRCKSDNIYFFPPKQVRSGDEGESVNRVCLDCGNMWK